MQNLIYDGNGIRLGQTGDGCAHEDVHLERRSKEPTCTEDGYHEGLWCTNCNSWVFMGNVKPKLGHKFSEATCQKAATCSTCGATQGSTLTCQDNGTGVCKWCGRRLVTATEQKPSEPAAVEAVPEITESAIVIETDPSCETTPDATWGVGATEAATETTASTSEPDHTWTVELCNPFSCGCWIYVALGIYVSLVIGVAAGWFLNRILKRNKK